MLDHIPAQTPLEKFARHNYVSVLWQLSLLGTEKFRVVGSIPSAAKTWKVF